MYLKISSFLFIITIKALAFKTAVVQNMEKVYAITSPLLSAFKLGAWSGQYKKLKVRYATYYGNNCSIVVYECQSCRSTESHLKKLLAPFHITNELYMLEGLTHFHTYCTTNCGLFVAMDNDTVHATQRAKRLKRHLETTNDMQNLVEERLLEMQEALPELIASIACGEQVNTAVLQAVGVDRKFIDMYNKRVVNFNKQLMAVGETHMMPPLNNEDIINDRLMHSPDISDEQFCDINKRVATAEECWAMYKHQYKVSWSIQLVSHQFIKDNGNQLVGSSMKILSKMLFPKIVRSQLLLQPSLQLLYGDPCDYHETGLSLQAAYLVKAELISEVMSCLGFKHPFDVEHKVPQEELIVLEGKTNLSKLMSTKFFADYNNNIKLFSDRAAIMVKSCRAYLEAANRFGQEDVWNHVSDFFIEQRKIFESATNALKGFLRSETILLAPEAYVPQADFIKALSLYCKENHFPQITFSPDFYAVPFNQFGITLTKRVKRTYPRNSDGVLKQQIFIVGCDINDNEVVSQDQ